MYYFKDIFCKEWITRFSPLEISRYIMFDAMNKVGDTLLVLESNVDYKTFYYQKS